MTDIPGPAPQNGYVEGIVRGYKDQLLTSTNYGNLTQCETIDGKSSCRGRA